MRAGEDSSLEGVRLMANPFRSFRPKEGPPWPLALELARLGTPIGCALVRRYRRLRVDGTGWVWYVDVVTVDGAGELVSLREELEGDVAGRWCCQHALRALPSVGELVRALARGVCVGWGHGFIGHSVVPWRSLAVMAES